jgi:hypothetical protein
VFLLLKISWVSIPKNKVTLLLKEKEYSDDLISSS